jgi:pyrophosphatase PpaX
MIRPEIQGTKQVTGNHKKFEYFLFDWDGCLVDTLPIWLEGMKEGLSVFGIDAPYEYIKQGFQTWDVFAELGVRDMELFAEEVNQYLHTHITDIKFNDGVPNLLKKLRTNDLKAAIVSSAEEPRVLPVLRRLEAIDFFECVVTRYDVGRLKPDPEPVERAIRGINGQKEKTVIIGDSLVDVESGKNAGISTVLYSSQVNQEYHLNIRASDLNPDLTISHMSEIEKLI